MSTPPSNPLVFAQLLEMVVAHLPHYALTHMARHTRLHPDGPVNATKTAAQADKTHGSQASLAVIFNNLGLLNK
jgi:hypothetical protein